MADIGAVGAGLVAAGWSAQKLLGPLFDEVAEEWRARYSARRVRNASRIIRVAEARATANGLLKEGAFTSPRVTNHLLENGSWCDDVVMSEYFGGILASSISDHGESDRGLHWSSLLASLPAIDVWLHYQIYFAIRTLFLGEDIDISWRRIQRQCSVYIPLSAITRAWKPTDPTNFDVYHEMGFSHGSLQRVGLLSEGGCDATVADFASERQLVVPEDGVLAIPSSPGTELFLWAHGYPRVAWRSLLDPDLDFPPIQTIGRVEGAIPASSLPTTGSDSSRAGG